MTLSPDQVTDQRFRIALRGYDVPEVDAFLQRLQKDLAQRAAAGVPDADPGHGGTAPQVLHILEQAEQTADRMIAEAAAESDEILAGARNERDRVLRDARPQPDPTETELFLRREREVGVLALRCEQLQAEMDRLEEFERRARESLQRWLSEERAELGERLVPEDVVDAEASEGPSA